MFKKLIFFHLLLSLFVGTNIAQAQKYFVLNGTVKDGGTGETLIGASVQLKGAATFATVTNAYGYYSLSVPAGVYELVYSYVGYQSISQNISIGGDAKRNVSLTSANQLNEIVVNAEKRNANVENPIMGVQKLDVKEINSIPVLFGERDILKTLQLLPGIKSAGEGNSGFYVRGGSTDQNLILLDEATVYNASHLLGFFSTFNSDAIKDATIYKGGMPAQYGGRLASVLDIKMNDGNKKDYTVEGGIGLIASRLKVEGPIKKEKSSFMVSGRRTYADSFLAFSSDTSVKGSTLYFYDLNAKANFILDDKNTIYLSGYFGRDKLGITNSFGFDWGNTTATLRLNHLFSNRLFSNTSLIYSNYNYLIKSLLEDNDFNVKSAIRNYNLKQDFQFTANNAHEIKFGLNLIHHTIAPGDIGASAASSVNATKIENRNGLELAAYFSDEYNVNDKLHLAYGARISNFSALGSGTFHTYDEDGNILTNQTYKSGELVKNYFNLEPRIAASYQFSNNKSVKASYTRNTQNLHLMSNSTATSPTDLYIMNSNNVKPEIADQIAIGYFNNFKDDTYEFSAELYYKDMKNQIEYRNGTDLRGNKNVEADLLFGDGRAYGVELFLKKRFGKFNGWIGYTLAKTERQFDQIDDGRWFNAKQDRTHDLSVVGIYKASPRWTLSSTFVYNTGNAVTYPSGKYQLDGETVFYYSERNGYRTPAYHRLDFSATLEPKLKPGRKYQSSWSFGIYNVYNRKNPFSIDFEDDPNDASRTQAVQTSLFGIIPSVTWNFKF
ncbi:collagen-binding protein [Pelobium manganitolerans]|uniref:Collagen-binding protein n=1 Tax=Pelobium manganitolerans TaxID=1842495 RepID=A0A419S4G5_9SPHI|nr:TonB-dependent receptor [Pelobium manganitolerans]RKD14502.1 collagen-binding protein [Pelobium manganitolerans]